MSDWKIPLYKIFTDDEDLRLVNNVIKRGKSWAIGLQHYLLDIQGNQVGS